MCNLFGPVQANVGIHSVSKGILLVGGVWEGWSVRFTRLGRRTMDALPVWDVAQWTHCPFGTSHITGCTLCQFGTSGSEGGRVGFLVSCTRVEFLPTVLYEHSFCLVLLDSYIFQVSIIDQQHTNRCTRVDFLPTGIYERSVGLICLDSCSVPSFHY